MIKYTIDTNTNCWLYIGKLLPTGYARAWNFAKQMNEDVHITMYESKYGPVPEGKELDHVKEKCKHRHCINPDHLEPVTHLENVLRGKNTKISAEIEEEIREIFKLNSRSEITEIAKRYSITRYTIWRLLRLKAARHGNVNILGGRKLRSDGKLTKKDIEEIKLQVTLGQTQGMVAKMFGIGQSHVSRIVRNLAGKDIQQ